MTGHSAVLGAGIQERNGAELPPSPCPLTPAPGGGSGVKGTVSPAPQSFRRSRGHSDLQGQLEERRWKSLGVGTRPGQAGGSGPGLAVWRPPRERPRPPPKLLTWRQQSHANPCSTVDKDGSSVPLSLNTKAENVCPHPHPPPFLEGSEDHG